MNILYPPAVLSKSRNKVKEFLRGRFSLLELTYDLLKSKGSECGVGPGVALLLINSFKTNCGATLKLSTHSPSLVRQHLFWVSFLHFWHLHSDITLITNIYWLQFPSAPTGGANRDKTCGRALWDDLGPQAVCASSEWTWTFRDHCW